MTSNITTQDEKVRENRLRRMAKRQQLNLVKSRRRDPRAFDYGAYYLIGIHGGDRFALTLDQVEKELTS
jgi:hypothetical protein